MFLAERIVDAIRSSDHFMEKSSKMKRHSASDVLRIWPTFKPMEWTREEGGRGRNFSERVIGVKLDKGEIDAQGNPYPDGEHVQEIRVYWKDDKYLAENHNWVILPCGPENIYSISGTYSKTTTAVPSHLWSSFWVKDRMREKR